MRRKRSICWWTTRKTTRRSRPVSASPRGEGRDIGAAFVRSLARPGANITGLSLSAGEDSTLAAKPLERHFQARRPDGVGPFPAVMLVPGRNGFLRNEEATHYARMADSLRDKGFVVIYVDYLAAPGIRRGCGGDVGTEDIAEDILAAAARLRMTGYVRASAISAIGESLGGGGVLAALTTLKSGAPALFDRAIVYFPVCVGIMPWQTPTPLLMLLGALDDITAPSLCKDLVARVTHPGSVEIHVYPRLAMDSTIGSGPCSASPTGGVLDITPKRPRRRGPRSSDMRSS